jgi:hypothetical protein
VVVHASTKLPNLIVPTSSLVETVASLLSRAPFTIAATTYLWELSRIFETTTPEPGYLCPWFTFRVCPACIKEQHILQRDHFLLGVTACQQHQLFLQSSCACGTALQPFDPSSSPFTCFQCEQAWGQLPHVQASAEDLEKEHAILACYCWWLRYADQAYLKDTLQLLMYSDVFSSGRKNRTPQRSPRWFDGLPRARFHLRPSCLGSLSWLVQDLDEKGLLARYEASK